MIIALEEITLFRDLGVSVVTVILMFQFMKWVAGKSFDQIEKVQKQLEDNNEKIFKFMECTFKENTRAITEMVDILKDHIRLKDEAIQMLKENHHKR